MIKLKLCPFCGATRGLYALDVDNSTSGEPQVFCDNCKAVFECERASTIEEAIEAWNTRYVDETQHTHCCPCGAERTCRNAWQYGGDVFQCSECGCQLALDDGYGNTIEFADIPKQSYPNNPMYCVGCGARVEGD